MKLFKLVCLLLLLSFLLQVGFFTSAAGDTELTVVVPVRSGDTNGDNAVNASDIIHLVRHILNADLSVRCDCDFNGDGRVNLLDVIRLLRYIISPTFELYKTAV